MYFGPDQQRVRLDVDLTRYHRHLEVGATGRLLPMVKVGIWGSTDRFGAVRFDCCGETLDVVLSQLTDIDEAGAPATVENT